LPYTAGLSKFVIHKMKTADLRSAFLSFFAERDHKVVPSSSLVPANDPTLLFTNAGMNQFKDPLLGREDPGYRRATSAQRCVRAGGKHNDLENVGYTARHHTFFEMLGNFSFGDYFKEETITWAWEFCIQVLNLPVDKIWVTVHPNDDESRRLWEQRIGVPRDRVVSLEENFWSMGDTGPCGPCSELFYDHGPAVSGGPPGSPDEDGDRYIEFWNLVFPQFDRQPDGGMNPLPQPGVDTGMGLERMAAIMQGVHSNYEIDLFQRLLSAIGTRAGINDLRLCLENPSVRVIADHIRSSAFLIADGILPGNEDRSYVLRRIIRRGLRHGYKLDIREPFFHELVAPLVEEMGEAYPELAEKQADVSQALLREEQRFAETLNQGMELLDKTIDGLSGREIPGDVVFQLYDTFGFPADLTADVARERELGVDMAGFDRAMQAQRDRGRAATTFTANLGQRVFAEGKVEFTGYESTEADLTVTGLFSAEGNPVEKLVAGEAGIVVADRTPFYGESGGQVGDTGKLQSDAIEFAVTDTQTSGDQHLHIGTLVTGELAAGIKLHALVDQERRQRIVRNHSATHLMHAALREVLGDHVEQKGSLVAPERLRFDFSHPEPMTAQQIARVEARVNQQVLGNGAVTAQVLPFADAIERGAMALFGEKYGDEVRVLSMGAGDGQETKFSVELCGGTHVARTGDVGLFQVVAESGVAAGVRRIEAVAGPSALEWVDEGRSLLNEVGALVKASRGDVVSKVSALLTDNRRLNKEIEQLQQQLASARGSDLVDTAFKVGEANVISARITGDAKSLMQTLDSLKSKLEKAVVVLAHVDQDKVSLIAGVSKDLTQQITAPELVNMVGAQVGARGGGRPDMARAGGGDNPDAVDQALASVQPWLSERLGAS
jgi:alanyl-tRNA synthetase